MNIMDRYVISISIIYIYNYITKLKLPPEALLEGVAMALCFGVLAAFLHRGS